jgi:arylsulfatase A-like enzyme
VSLARISIAFGLALLTLHMSDCAEPPHRPTSVLLVTIDTLRADHLSAYGYEKSTSPNLDAFMARGTRFRWAFSTSSYTGPSHSSILTGLYPSFHHGLTNYGSKLPVRTLADACRESDLRTAAIISNPVLQSRYGTIAQGFDSYDDKLRSRVLNRRHAERRADQAVDRAIAKIRNLASEPFFLWLHIQDPHGPYDSPSSNGPGSANLRSPIASPALPLGSDHSGHGAIPRYQLVGAERHAEQYIARYDDEIRFADNELGRLFDELDALELGDRLLVVITSDHGEAFGENGFHFAHGHAVTPDQSHVPLAFVGPGISVGGVLETSVSTLDIHPTILDFLGLPANDAAQGRSLRKSLLRGSEPTRLPVYVESFGHRAVVADGLMLHMDRRPAEDRQFWQQAHPVSSGHFEPLGPRWFELRANGSPNATDPPTSGIAELLVQFSDRAEKTLLTVEAASGNHPTPSNLDALRALGYVR